MTEIREAFMVFAPYRHIPKVTVFGSARTATHDPVYEQARRIAEALAERGWMVVTGAGPGIMQAAMEGAGRARSIGVAIRLPFEQGANPVIAGDEKYVSMKYFFTRKLMLVKESRAFVCLPGGFGTLDETFELLTLTQTGKGLPVPIVLLDPPHDPFWKRIDEMIHELLVVPQPGLAARHQAVLRDRLGRGGVRRDRSLLRQLPLDPLRRRPGRDPSAPRAHRRGDGRAATTTSDTSSPTGASPALARWTSSGATTTTSSCRGCASPSSSTGPAICVP